MKALATRIHALAALVAVAAFLMLSSTALAAPCATLDLSVNSTTASPGQKVPVASSVTNCSNQSETLRIHVTLTGPDGTLMANTVMIELQPGETRSASVPFAIPEGAEPGNYTVTATAASQNMQLATATAMLRIT